MKTCPRCGEMNGDNNTVCFKCGAVLGPVGIKKMCPRCQRIYAEGAERCEYCGVPLISKPRYVPSAPTMEKIETWLLVIAILLPELGAIIGLIYIGQKREIGPRVIVISVAALFIQVFLLLFLFSCAA